MEPQSQTVDLPGPREAFQTMALVERSGPRGGSAGGRWRKTKAAVAAMVRTMPEIKRRIGVWGEVVYGGVWWQQVPAQFPQREQRYESIQQCAD